MPSLPSSAFAPRFFAGSSEMHFRMSRFDWANTPVGAPQNWPQSLKTAVKMLLGAQHPMVLTWGEGCTGFYNDAFSLLLGDKHPAALGSDLRVTLAKSWDVWEPSIAQVMQNGQSNWAPALPFLLDRNGCRKEALFNVSHSPVEDDDGQVVGTLAICSEVAAPPDGTPDPANAEFFSGLSHEFRTPLALISGPLQELLERPEGIDAAVREPVEIAHRNSLRLLKLVDTLLDFSRLEAARMQPQFQPTDLAALTSELAQTLQPALQKAGLRFVVNCEVLGQPVWVDREMWENIVLNLLSNALKFTREGEIELRLSAANRPDAANPRVVLTVRDSGGGIPPAVLSHVFERFHRVQSAPSSSDIGTGLGLAQVRDLVELHGGTLDLQSEWGRGTTLEVQIPVGPPASMATVADHANADHANADHANAALADAAAVSSPRSQVPVAKSPASKEQATLAETPSARVLVVDDSADMRDYVRGCLDDSYEIWGAGSARDALEMTRREVPDLILCDIMMPGLDGLGLLELLRADAATRDVPLIFLSARAGSQARIEALDRGAQGCLVKPFAPGALRERVEACLSVGRRRREEAHHQVEEILESITDAFYALDGEFRFTYVNRQTESFFGRKRDELLGKVLWEEFPTACNTEFETNYRAVMDGRQATHFEALSPVFHRWIDVNVYPSARGISVYFRDVSERHRDQTERERLLREAQAASLVKDEFLAIVSHELRTPLNAILGWSNLIASGGLEEADQLRGLETIERSARAQAQIIEDILDISRIVTGKMRLEAHPMPLQPALEAAIEVIRPAAGAKGISIDFEMEESLGLVAGDASRLQQVFWNLLSNAVKFTPANGRIWVGGRLRSADVEVAISDSGRGIAPDFLPHVFERFRQGDMSSTREVGGLGLGLSIVRQIVELHGGGIEAQSEGVGQGSTFFVTLPRLQNRSSSRAARGQSRAEDAQNPLEDGWRSAHALALQGMRVLVVDDERDAREVVAMLLQRSGAQVDFAASSVEAMRAFGNVKFDLIVSDIAMPGGDGYELIGKLRRAAISQGRLPVLAVALTAHTRPDDRQRALDAGFQEHISKPIDPDEFLHTIGTLLGTH